MTPSCANAIRAALTLLLALGWCASAAPVPKRIKPPASYDGRWESVERVNRGAKVVGKWVWEIRGDKLTPYSESRGGTLQPTYTGATLTLAPPDPTRPDELDYRYTAGTTELVYRGRAEWDGDEWLFCFGEAGADRPAKVQSGADVYLLRFRRIKDEEK